jgi:hypothetical protein
VDESLRTLYDHAEKAGKGVGQPNGSWAAREESGGQVTVSLSPLFLPEDHNFNLTEALFYATNYGRNMAMWPKVVAVDGSESDFKVERPDLVPCELYYDGLKGRDYTVFRDAPLLEDGTYMFVNLNDEDE